MTEHGMLLSAPMVRARVARLKGQTRRLVDPQPFPDPNGHGWQWHSKALWAAGYGSDYVHTDLEHVRRAMEVASKFKVGDRIWWREAWRTGAAYDSCSPAQIDPGASLFYEADKLAFRINRRPECGPEVWGRYRHARFMPRWACRLVDEITEVRVQRLQDISETDAIAEGIEPNWIGDLKVGPNGSGGQGWVPDCGWRHYLHSEDGEPAYTAVESYRSLWEFIHGPSSWDLNPLVVAITFREVTQ